jgi:urease accessory protein
MLQVHQRLDHTHDELDDSITLDYDTRQKARIKALTDKGQSIGIFVERGHPLRIGELLKSDCGKLIEIKGALESVITASTESWFNFARICYHLGNRHTKIQIGEKWLRFKPDHVLQALVEKFALTIDDSDAIFEPESGAYTGVHEHGHHSHEH